MGKSHARNPIQNPTPTKPTRTNPNRTKTQQRNTHYHLVTFRFRLLSFSKRSYLKMPTHGEPLKARHRGSTPGADAVDGLTFFISNGTPRTPHRPPNCQKRLDSAFKFPLKDTQKRIALPLLHVVAAEAFNFEYSWVLLCDVQVCR